MCGRAGIEYAYDLKPFQVGEGPDWMDTVRYDIQAHAAKPDATNEEMQLMLQSLLQEQFNLQVHRESQNRLTYVMTVGSVASQRQWTGGRRPCRIPDPNSMIPPPPLPLGFALKAVGYAIAAVRALYAEC